MRNKYANAHPADGPLSDGGAPVDAPARAPRLFHLLAQAKQNLFRSADAHFTGELGYSGTQVVALFALKSEEGCQLKDLGRLLHLKNSAITGLVTRMEDKGLIERAPCSQDGRAIRIRISPKGNEVLAKAFPVLNSLNAQLMNGFSPDELATIARFLTHASRLTFEKVDSL